MTLHVLFYPRAVSYGSGQSRAVISRTGCNEVIPDVDRLKLDIVVTEKATQINTETSYTVKGKLRKIFDHQNDLQIQLKNLRMTKITKASPSTLDWNVHIKFQSC